MKYQFLLFALICMVENLTAQYCDFVTPRYEVNVQDSIYFGSDTLFDGSVKDLYMTIYKPDNEEEERPLMIWVFGGGFFTGNRQSFDETCMEMARRGFVAAAIDYRLGYVNLGVWPLPVAYDDKELLRAGYRAMQDVKGAIRFLKERSEKDSVDLGNIFVGGASAGAIASLAAVYVDEDTEWDIDVTGELPETTFPQYDRPDLGPIEGRLHVGNYDASVKGVINIFGAVFDTQVIKKEDPQVVFSYHQVNDPLVACGYDKAYAGYGPISDNMPYGYGSCMIDLHLRNLGKDSTEYTTWIYNGNEHAIHNVDQLMTRIGDFLQYHICERLVGQEETRSGVLEIYPNPTQDEVRISAMNEEGWMSLYHQSGQWIRDIHVKQGQGVNVRDLAPGIYWVLDVTSGCRGRFVKM